MAESLWDKYNPRQLFSNLMGQAYAEKMQNAEYPQQVGFLDQADAFRHLLWMGEMQRKFGTLPANVVGLFNEAVHSGGHPLDSRMDLNNNRVALAAMQNAKSREDVLKIAKMLMEKSKAVNTEEDYQQVEKSNSPFYVGDFAIQNPKLFEDTTR